jgi:hypothetical protein
MKQEMLKERVELLAIGEAIGYPRLGIGQASGRKLSIRAGQGEWEKFCGHAHTTRIPAALRIGRILRDNHVMPYNPLRSPRESESDNSSTSSGQGAMEKGQSREGSRASGGRESPQEGVAGATFEVHGVPKKSASSSASPGLSKTTGRDLAVPNMPQAIAPSSGVDAGEVGRNRPGGIHKAVESAASIIRLDDPDELVKPKRSSAAIRQQRWRDKQKGANA